MFDERGKSQDRRQEERRTIYPLTSRYSLVTVLGERGGIAVFDSHDRIFIHHVGGAEVFDRLQDVVEMCKTTGEQKLIEFAKKIEGYIG